MPELTDDFMAEYVREHRCYNAIRGVSLADWDRGVRVLIERGCAALAAPTEVPARPNPEERRNDRRRLLLELGGLIQSLHVPRSMPGMLHPLTQGPYDRARAIIGDVGWSTGPEVAERLEAYLLDEPT